MGPQAIPVYLRSCSSAGICAISCLGIASVLSFPFQRETCYHCSSQVLWGLNMPMLVAFTSCSCVFPLAQSATPQHDHTLPMMHASSPAWQIDVHAVRLLIASLIGRLWTLHRTAVQFKRMVRHARMELHRALRCEALAPAQNIEQGLAGLEQAFDILPEISFGLVDITLIILH